MKKSANTNFKDAIDLLEADHREAEKAFEKFKKLAADDNSKKK